MFKIGKVQFKKKNTVIIAEAGVNHNGKIKYAKKLIDEASKSGCDIIKFQTYKANLLTTKNAPRFWNWKGERKKGGSQFDSYSILDSFNKEHYKWMINYCKKKKIEFLSTPFDKHSCDMLTKLGVKGFKIASCDITNHDLIQHIAKKKLPILLSTGAANITEIKNAVKVIEKTGNKKILIMHCILCYPTKIKDANLLSIKYLQKKFPKYLVGLSDHTLGIDTAKASIPLGTTAIEKHFTFNKKLKKSADHWLSINPRELKELTNFSKNTHLAMGTETKKVLNCEILSRKNARRSIVAKYDLSKYQKITLNDITFKRPGHGIPASDYKKIIGKKLSQNIKEDELILYRHLKK